MLPLHVLAFPSSLSFLPLHAFLSTVQKKSLVVRDTDYQVIAGHLYKMGADNILRRCVLEHERPIILVESHEGITGGYYVGKANEKKVFHE
jgi:hypothetical protein